MKCALDTGKGSHNPDAPGVEEMLRGAFITGSTFLADGGATASYYYGPLQPQE